MIDSPEKIKEIRSEMGLSLKKFSKLMGVTPDSVVKWEKGSRKISKSRLMLLEEKWKNFNLKKIYEAKNGI